MSVLSGIKRVIPEKWKIKVRLLFVSSKNPNWMVYGTMSKQVIYVFLAGFYQNLGDMAITYAQRCFLQQLYPNAEIVTIPSTKTYEAVKTIRKVIRPADIVTIIGGGNMDDAYLSLEEARLHVVKNFPRNKVVSFPQTFHFSAKPLGQKRQEASHKVYSKHRNLTIFVREPYSLERISEAFPDVKVFHCPDIVLSLNKFEPQYERHGVLCCLRSDKEQEMLSEQRDNLIQAAKEKFDDVTVKDTVDVALSECTEETYEQTLENFWVMLRHKEVVITDRLHCMIFCAITGTPCVVMDNSNHKISGVHQAWLKDAEYIRFLETNDASTVLQAADEVRKIKVDRVVDLTEQYDALRNACK